LNHKGTKAQIEISVFVSQWLDGWERYETAQVSYLFSVGGT